MFPKRFLIVLNLCVTLTLAARGWLTWHWDSPIRGLVWQEDWWSGFLKEQLNLDWTTFAENSDPAITTGLQWIGIALIVLSFVPWLMQAKPLRWTRWLLWPAFLLLMLDSFARWVAADYTWGMAIEHSLQMVAPLALFLTTVTSASRQLWAGLVATAAAFTFVGHGLYAAGIHPVPLSYQNMTANLTGLSEAGTLLFLKIAGWLDFVAAAFLLIRPLRLLGVCYMILWGGATALARTAAHFDLNEVGASLDPWIAETLVRSSHWMLPLLLGAAFVALRRSAKRSESTSIE